MSDQLRRKLDDKSSLMILIGYHSTGGYKLFDPLNKQVVISRDVVIDELEEWDLDDNFKKDSVRILCDEPTNDVGRGNRLEGHRIQAGTSIPQMTRNMSTKLQECVITLDDMVNDKGELVHYASYEDTEPVNVVGALKDSKWMQAMMEKLKSIEVKIIWSLVELPQGKKTIDVK